ncbi:Hypothetical predicted protein [Olea europaea subsp. europaea]|uniref:Transmembrane protein n=1 Tax=Olea europaea subsp. europaea TaxID=158383 RepID=A0A8S0QAW3_OLEEU|nr:Hypothetical predicted protein [Olea europaea subsp. europaea]
MWQQFSCMRKKIEIGEKGGKICGVGLLGVGLVVCEGEKGMLDLKEESNRVWDRNNDERGGHSSQFVMAMLAINYEVVVTLVLVVTMEAVAAISGMGWDGMGL